MNEEEKEKKKKKDNFPAVFFILALLSFIGGNILYFVTTSVEEIIGNITLSVLAIPIYYFIKEIFKHIDFRP